MNLKQYYLAARKRAVMAVAGRYVLRRRSGLLLLLDMRNHIDRHVEAFGYYERLQTQYFIGRLADTNIDYFIDIGAHWGWYSLLVAQHQDLRRASIYAFEPDDHNRAQLSGNLFLNNQTDRVRVLREALSDREGSISFEPYGDENRGRSRIHEAGSRTVPVRPLDAFLNMAGARVGIKIDVEGHEIKVLQGAKNFLQQNECLIQVECFQETSAALQDMLISLGYRQDRQIGHDFYYSNGAIADRGA